MPVSSNAWRMSPSNRPTVGKFCTPAKPSVRSSSRNSRGMMNGSVPLTPASTGVLLDHRQDLVGHLLDDLVGVAVSEQAGGAAAAGHPVAARVVDDQQVDAPRLLADRREAGAGAAADDRLAAGDLLAEAVENRRPSNCPPVSREASAGSFRVGNERHQPCGRRPRGRHQLEQCPGRGIRKAGIVDVQVQLDDLASGSPARMASCSARRAAGSSNGCPSLSMAETPRPGSSTATGPAPPTASARCRRRSRAFSVRRRPHQRDVRRCAGRTAGPRTAAGPSRVA